MLCSSKYASLRNGSRVLMRFLENGDQMEVIRFFQRVPREDMRFLTNFSANTRLLDSFLYRHDHSQNSLLLALEIYRKKIIGAVFFARSAGATHHIGEVYGILVARPFQKMGLATLLLDECIGSIRLRQELMADPVKVARFPCGSPQP
jgi:ribosomal protein S18 acetylase RimI-like enzyme